jgi:uncharacterized protein (TIGR02646 family)
MRAFKRGTTPGILETNWETWGQAWEERKNHNPAACFHWHQHENTPVNQLLLPPLKEQTQAHCSFCDIFPVSPPGQETIEHFKPKQTFPRFAYKWDNLYYCCSFCQGKKLEKFDGNLLSPDTINYEFDRYFRWDFTNGYLLVNEQASLEDKKRASITIEIYGLNEGHPFLRMRELRRRVKDQQDSLDNFAYRNFLSTDDLTSDMTFL